VGVGSLLRIKRWDRVLKVVRKVRSLGYDCRLTIAGRGPERAALEQQARELGLGWVAEFIGATTDVPDLLGQSRLLVHASETEGCPNAVMGAMACGRAVGATDAGDVPYLVEDGKTGFVVCYGDHEMLVKRLMELFTDRDLCQSTGKAGRAKAEREFGLDHLGFEPYLHTRRQDGGQIC